MSLDNIQLSPEIIQAIYNKSLYDLVSVKPVSAEINSDPKISFLGNNKKNILLLVSSKEAVYLPEEELNFLLSILGACNLSMSDIALINLFRNPELQYTTLLTDLAADKILLFGINAAEIGLPLKFPDYQIQHYNNQVYLSSVSLQQLQHDKNEKLKLWNCLKTLFT